MEKLNDEVRSTFADVEHIHSGSALSSCHYLRACIDEALRLSPPVGALLPRVVLPGGATIDGHRFPAGVDVGSPIYAIHHNEAYHPDPFEFKPSRWLSGSNEDVVLARSAFCPFSLGPRGCAGKALAYAEITLILARILWLFDMSLAGGARLGGGDPGATPMRRRSNEYQLVDKFVGVGQGPLVAFRSRFNSRR